ncbi:helix-turn-helix domain-containing protein [Phocaeicola barnesiae]|nr:helix-turn-helix domain-containing protein [Phocaeicola barnesiae]
MTHNDAVNVDTIYTQAGFGSRTTFYRQFKQLTGLTPKQFLKQRVS